MGVSNYNYLPKTDSGYTRYNSTTRADFQNKITPTARYSRPTSTTVRENPEGISRTKGRDQGVTKRSSAITATTSYTSASSVHASSVRASSVRASPVRTSSV